MDLKQYIGEEFHGYVKADYVKEPVAYYINPTPSDMLEVAHEEHDNLTQVVASSRARRLGNIRFILDLSKKKVYIFSAVCLHYEVGTEIGYPSSYFTRESPNNIFNGEAVYDKEQRKLSFLYSDSMAFKTPEYVKNMSKLDWSFADRFFTKPVKKIIASINPSGKIYKVDKKA